MHCVRYAWYLVAILVALINLSSGALAAEREREACARLLVVTAGTGAVELYSLDENGDEQPEPLQPLMFLFAADRLVLPVEASAVLLSYATSTRETHFGPTVLSITEQGLKVLESGGDEPLIEELELDLEPVVVDGRTDIRGATMYTRGNEHCYLELQYPVATAIAPGEVLFEWSAAEVTTPLALSLYDQTDNLCYTVELPSDARSQLIEVEPGEYYRWGIIWNDSRQAWAHFNTLGTDSWSALNDVLTGMGQADSSLPAWINSISDVTDLTCLLSLFQYYGLSREMELTLNRLTTVLQER